MRPRATHAVTPERARSLAHFSLCVPSAVADTLTASVFINIMKEVESLLLKWGFQAYVHKFEENEVDICALELLDDEQVRALIPSIGPQAKFKKILSDWKNVRQWRISYQKDEELEEIISNCDSFNTFSQGSPSTSSTRSECSISLCSQETQYDLALLLSNTPDTKLLLTHDVQKPLGEQYRKILVRAIAREIVRKNPQAHVTSDIYLDWLQKINLLFPAENLECYYTKPKTGVHRAHGRLFDAVVNLKAKYRRHKVYQPRARRSLDNTLTPSSSNQGFEETLTPSTSNQCFEETTTQEEEECMEWLRCSSDDYALCAEKWEKTNKLRKKRVHSNEKQSYLQEFPCLKRSFGYELLIADFDTWYPENKYNFENKLPLLKSKLLSASESTSRRSPFVEELKQLAQDKDLETSNLAALLLIPHLIGPVHIKRKRHSAAEVRQSFILHIEEERQLLEEIKKRQDKYKGLGITIQPHYIREHLSQGADPNEENAASDHEIILRLTIFLKKSLVSLTILDQRNIRLLNNLLFSLIILRLLLKAHKWL
ncbi:hypothetical protein NE865_01317 [Phthorimaea operculella]|nr:hypothetical protein NE865_01317 [Phthorimaea operculella]